MNNKLKVCFATEEFYPKFVGGQGIYGLNYVTHLAKVGHKVTVLAEYYPGRANFWKKKKKIKLFLTPFCFKNALILSLFEFLIFHLKLKDTKFDVLHANQLSGLFFALFKPKNVGKVVISIHHTNLEMQKIADSFLKRLLYYPLIFLEKVAYKKADGLLFNSPQERDEVVSFYNLDPGKTSFAYLGVDYPKFGENEKINAKIFLRKKLNIPKNSKIVLYVGRLVKKKRVDLFLKAIRNIQKVNKNIYAVIVGKGPEENNLRNFASTNVFFEGFQDDLKTYYLASDTFVTISEAEGGFLLTALDAASFGLPLILSKSPAGFPIIEEGKNGFVLQTKNPKLLSLKIIETLKKADIMGMQSRKFAKNFSWEKCIKSSTKFYRTLIYKKSSQVKFAKSNYYRKKFLISWQTRFIS